MRLKEASKPLRRLYSPIEVEKLKKESFGEDKLTQRHARRTLSKAPLPPGASKISLMRNIGGIVTEIKEHLSHIDYMTLALVLCLAFVGILAVYSATLTKGSSRFVMMQAAMTVFGVFIMLGLSYVDYDIITKNYRYVLILNVILLVITLIFGKGADTGGETNRNWLYIGPFGVQPAEFGKILYIITFASHLDAVKHRINNVKTLIGLALHSGLIIGLVLLEKDLGQATVYMAITVVMLFAAKLSIWYFAGGLVAGTAALPIIWPNLEDYQKKRILVGFNPELDPLDKGYQAIKSKTAIAAGGITGLGYKKGLVTQSGVLPAKWTDMIFAVICEEAGLIGAAFVLLLLFLLVVRIFIHSHNAEKMSGSLICAGVAGMLMYQIIENVGMCLGMLPVVGITLPFLSYGGSSMLGMYLAVGMTLSVYASGSKKYFNKW